MCVISWPAFSQALGSGPLLLDILRPAISWQLGGRPHKTSTLVKPGCKHWLRSINLQYLPMIKKQDRSIYYITVATGWKHLCLLLRKNGINYSNWQYSVGCTHGVARNKNTTRPVMLRNNYKTTLDHRPLSPISCGESPGVQALITCDKPINHLINLGFADLLAHPLEARLSETQGGAMFHGSVGAWQVDVMQISYWSSLWSDDFGTDDKLDMRVHRNKMWSTCRPSMTWRAIQVFSQEDMEGCPRMVSRNHPHMMVLLGTGINFGCACGSSRAMLCLLVWLGCTLGVGGLQLLRSFDGWVVQPRNIQLLFITGQWLY